MATQEEKLLAYCAEASEASPAEIVDIIRRATSDPSLFIFGELLHMPQIQQLVRTGHAPAVDLLQLFARGVYRDYVAAHRRYQLDETQIAKLRQLSIVSMASEQRVLPYRMLLEELGLDTVRSLEDLVIESVYMGLIHAKMDQRGERLVVQSAAGRDVVSDDQVQGMRQVVAEWQRSASRVLTELESRIEYVSQACKRNDPESSTAGGSADANPQVHLAKPLTPQSQGL